MRQLQKLQQLPGGGGYSNTAINKAKMLVMMYNECIANPVGYIFPYRDQPILASNTIYGHKVVMLINITGTELR